MTGGFEHWRQQNGVHPGSVRRDHGNPIVRRRRHQKIVPIPANRRCARNHVLRKMDALRPHRMRQPGITANDQTNPH